MTTYLVERYLPDVTVNSVFDAAARLRRIAVGAGVRYLWCGFVEEEETCFCLFEAPSAETLVDLNKKVDFDFAHIFPVTLGADASARRSRSR